MSKLITPGSTFDDDLVDDSFSYEISLSPDNVTTTITSSLNDTNVTITNGTNSAKIEGNYTSDIQFPISVVKYIEKGKSDKMMSPIISDINNTPSGKEILSVEGDPKKDIIITYTVIGVNSLGVTTTSVFTHKIMQNYSKIKNWLVQYMS